MPILWAVYGLPAGLSFAIGSLLSLRPILSLEFIIRRMVSPAVRREQSVGWDSSR